MRKPNRADQFDVWGAPPAALMNGLRPKQIAALKVYVDNVTDKAYRLAHENGMVHALCMMSTVAAKELRRLQSASLRRRK